MFLGGDAGHGLEPVGKMGGPLLQGPLLHNVGDGVRIRPAEKAAVGSCIADRPVHVRWKALRHDVLGKNHCPEIFCIKAHFPTPSLHKNVIGKDTCRVFAVPMETVYLIITNIVNNSPRVFHNKESG